MLSRWVCWCGHVRGCASVCEGMCVCLYVCMCVCLCLKVCVNLYVCVGLCVGLCDAVDFAHCTACRVHQLLLFLTRNSFACNMCCLSHPCSLTQYVVDAPGRYARRVAWVFACVCAFCWAVPCQAEAVVKEEKPAVKKGGLVAGQRVLGSTKVRVALWEAFAFPILHAFQLLVQM